LIQSIKIKIKTKKKNKKHLLQKTFMGKKGRKVVGGPCNPESKDDCKLCTTLDPKLKKQCAAICQSSAPLRRCNRGVSSNHPHYCGEHARSFMSDRKDVKNASMWLFATNDQDEHDQQGFRFQPLFSPQVSALQKMTTSQLSELTTKQFNSFASLEAQLHRCYIRRDVFSNYYYFYRDDISDTQWNNHNHVVVELKKMVQKISSEKKARATPSAPSPRSLSGGVSPLSSKFSSLSLSGAHMTDDSGDEEEEEEGRNVHPDMGGGASSSSSSGRLTPSQKRNRRQRKMSKNRKDSGERKKVERKKGGEDDVDQFGEMGQRDPEAWLQGQLELGVDRLLRGAVSSNERPLLIMVLLSKLAIYIRIHNITQAPPDAKFAATMPFLNSVGVSDRVSSFLREQLKKTKLNRSIFERELMVHDATLNKTAVLIRYLPNPNVISTFDVTFAPITSIQLRMAKIVVDDPMMSYSLRKSLISRIPWHLRSAVLNAQAFEDARYTALIKYLSSNMDRKLTRATLTNKFTDVGSMLSDVFELCDMLQLTVRQCRELILEQFDQFHPHNVIDCLGGLRKRVSSTSTLPVSKARCAATCYSQRLAADTLATLNFVRIKKHGSRCVRRHLPDSPFCEEHRIFFQQDLCFLKDLQRMFLKGVEFRDFEHDIWIFPELDFESDDQQTVFDFVVTGRAIFKQLYYDNEDVYPWPAVQEQNDKIIHVIDHHSGTKSIEEDPEALMTLVPAIEAANRIIDKLPLTSDMVRDNLLFDEETVAYLFEFWFDTYFVPIDPSFANDIPQMLPTVLLLLWSPSMTFDEMFIASDPTFTNHDINRTSSGDALLTRWQYDRSQEVANSLAPVIFGIVNHLASDENREVLLSDIVPFHPGLHSFADEQATKKHIDGLANLLRSKYGTEVRDGSMERFTNIAIVLWATEHTTVKQWLYYIKGDKSKLPEVTMMLSVPGSTTEQTIAQALHPDIVKIIMALLLSKRKQTQPTDEKKKKKKKKNTSKKSSK
jgi:hypothetical protein